MVNILSLYVVKFLENLNKYECLWIFIYWFNRSCVYKMFWFLFDKELNFDIKRGGVKFYEK